MKPLERLVLTAIRDNAWFLNTRETFDAFGALIREKHIEPVYKTHAAFLAAGGRAKVDIRSEGVVGKGGTVNVNEMWRITEAGRAALDTPA